MRFSSQNFLDEVYATFWASTKSVGTACTLAAIGIYLHRTGIVESAQGKRTLAVISQQVTLPLLFFTKIIYCNQDWSEDPCPNIAESIKDVWSLILWPLYVVSLGWIVGYVAARLSGTPLHQRKAVWVACAFGNSTGLPITLLTVVHSNFSADTDLGRIDPTMFLSVYLLMYPVLQWGIGTWLLAPEEEEMATVTMVSTPETKPLTRDEESHPLIQQHPLQSHEKVVNEGIAHEQSPTVPRYCQGAQPEASSAQTLPLPPPRVHFERTSSAKWKSSIHKTLQRFFPPPVVGALAGIFIAAIPNLRGIFVDLVDRRAHAPFQWMFDALYQVGSAAVPINMMILGCNLSASFSNLSCWKPFKKDYSSDEDATADEDSKTYGPDQPLFSPSTTSAIVIGKMVIMPILGFVSTYYAKQWYWASRIPDEIDGGFYLVALIVFLTPTANNVMVMVELSSNKSGGGKCVKAAMARVIAWQYALAPLILSITMTIAVCISVGWS